MTRPTLAEQSGGNETAIDVEEFRLDVIKGLDRPPQKFLSSKYLYDAVGSALFETITLLPEYGLTRADERLLETCAPSLREFFSAPPVVAELGSGTGTKTRRVLNALTGMGDITYYPIDVSVAALERCQIDLGQIPQVTLHPLASAYMDGLRQAVDLAPDGSPILVLFLGSSIGNFDRDVAAKFVGDVRRILRPGDVFFLGTDLVKPADALIAAYDDEIGVTAAFNRNVLSRINRELGGEFDISRFRHRARWNATERRVEMHLEAVGGQEVGIQAAGCRVSFADGESIWTESSHKFTCEEVAAMGRDAGFACARQWTDPEWPFAESVLIAE